MHHVCAHMHAYTRSHMCTCTHVQTHMHMHGHLHTYTHTQPEQLLLDSVEAAADGKKTRLSPSQLKSPCPL